MTTFDAGPARLPGSAPTTDTAPARASGVELIGGQPGSGYRVPPALVQRADGQVLSVTPLLYAVLAAIDGRRTDDEIAAAVSVQIRRAVSARDVRTLIDAKLRPLGLVRSADGADPPLRKPNPLLALRFRWVVADQARTRALTAPFAALFHPVVVVLVTLAFAAVGYWVLFDKGLASAASDAFADPAMLLAVFAMTVVSAGFHEFGHAAALRRGGGTPGAMGAGLYLVWPAFYTDVTDAYRLPKRARLRTDLGGLYFNALVALAMFAMWAGTGWDGLLLVIATQILQMLRQLPPLLRFDGYHILADATGVPDLYRRIKPTLQSLWPTHWRDPRARQLKPWVRTVITVWVLIAVPLMALTLLITVLTLPRILATAAHSFAAQWSLLQVDWQRGKGAGVGAEMLALAAVAVPVFGVACMLTRLVRQLARSTWRRTTGRPVARTIACLSSAALVAGLAWVWWPRGNYRVIEPAERGVMSQVWQPGTLTALAHGRPGFAEPAQQPLADGETGTARTVWPRDGRLPQPGHPELVMVLRPHDPARPTWVFPFDRPASPGPGGNQALAVATRDGSVVYDVAFALVTTSKDVVLNRNEAYAFASCRDCAAVAISFQVVLVVGHAQVIAPQNLSAAVNDNCVRCVAAAMAVQLDLRLSSRPDASAAAQLRALWSRIQTFSRRLRSLPLSAVRARLEGYERQVLQILRPYAAASSTAATSASPSGSPSPSPSAGAPTSSAGAPASVDTSAALPSAAPSTSPRPSSTATGFAATTASVAVTSAPSTAAAANSAVP